MKKQEYKQIIDELINGGHDLAQKIINEQTTKDSSEKLTAISGFIEVLMEIDKQYPNTPLVSNQIYKGSSENSEDTDKESEHLKERSKTIHQTRSQMMNQIKEVKEMKITKKLPRHNLRTLINKHYRIHNKVRNAMIFANRKAAKTGISNDLKMSMEIDCDNVVDKKVVTYTITVQYPKDAPWC